MAQTSPRSLQKALINKYYAETNALRSGRKLKQYEIEEREQAEQMRRAHKNSILKGLKRGAKVIDSLAEKEIYN